MKQDKLEEFIVRNREEFDDLVPDPRVWDKIQDNIEPANKVNWMGMIWKAAAVLVIFTASYFFHDFMDKNQISRQSAIITEDETEPESAETVQMLLEAEAYYTSQINTRKEEVFLLAGNNPALISDINLEFEELDQVLEELKNDLKDFTATEEIIEAMIQNYRLKLTILEDMLIQLKTAQQSEKNEKSYEYEI